MNDPDTAIRTAIKNALREAGLTEAQLARDLDVTRSHVNQIISGERGKIPKSLIDVLEALGLELVVRPKA